MAEFCEIEPHGPRTCALAKSNAAAAATCGVAIEVPDHEGENVRNSLGLNYQYAALSDCVRGTECSESLLSAVGAALVPPLLPSITPFRLLTF